METKLRLKELIYQLENETNPEMAFFYFNMIKDNYPIHYTASMKSIFESAKDRTESIEILYIDSEITRLRIGNWPNTVIQSNQSTTDLINALKKHHHTKILLSCPE